MKRPHPHHKPDLSWSLWYKFQFYTEPLWRKLRQFFCLHEYLRVKRMHKNTVWPDEKHKLLYVDRHDVHCFIECRKCRKVFNTFQVEALYDTKDE